MLSRFEAALTTCLAPAAGSSPHLPTVRGLAEQLAVSPDHLSEQLRMLTGRSAQEHIHRQVLAKVKELLSTTALPISEIAFRLGYEHAPSFTKLFQRKEGSSPAAFRHRFRS